MSYIRIPKEPLLTRIRNHILSQLPKKDITESKSNRECIERYSRKHDQQRMWRKIEQKEKQQIMYRKIEQYARATEKVENDRAESKSNRECGER